MSTSRQTLYERLPEIYRIRDQQQQPANQLHEYVDALDSVFAAIRDNIEVLYNDHFIETCADWVIPYIADLLGTTHLSGDPWTLRADVARTVHHRRRKGTLGAVESLTYGLTGWAVHTLELRDRLVWNQHLNHQRPDWGGTPPLPELLDERRHIRGAIRGGTITLRDPALLNFLNGPFDPFAHTADVKPGTGTAIRYNIPNLAIFLWRLQDYTLPLIKPDFVKIQSLTAADPAHASFAVRFNVHPLGEPMVLFNKYRFHADDEPPNISSADETPGPMPRARLTQSENMHEQPRSDYVRVDHYSNSEPPEKKEVGLTIHVPDPPFVEWNPETSSGVKWTFRGASLLAWEQPLDPPLGKYEIAIDPDNGRMVIGVGGSNQNQEARPLRRKLLVSPTYGFSGDGSSAPVGAHPVTRIDSPQGIIKINFDTVANGKALEQELANLADISQPRVIEIEDSRTYTLDLNNVTGVSTEGGKKVLKLGDSLHIRAAANQRPIIILERPLMFRSNDINQAPNVTLEGLYISWNHGSTHFGANTGLIERAAINELTIMECTLDPGSHQALCSTRQSPRYGLRLTNTYGFSAGVDTATFLETLRAFGEIPNIKLENSICGPIAMDDGYTLSLNRSIVDAASGVDGPSPKLALHAATGPVENAWGPELSVNGMTCFGRMRVEKASGEGGIWVHRLEVHNNQTGCIKFSYFSGNKDRLPQNHGCVFGHQVSLSFVSEVFGEAGYAQLGLRSDTKILQQGPNRDEMGAFGYLLNSHKWKNINIRYREFMPVGIHPVLVPVT
jgi:hypothetical protein